MWVKKNMKKKIDKMLSITVPYYYLFLYIVKNVNRLYISEYAGLSLWIALVNKSKNLEFIFNEFLYKILKLCMCRASMFSYCCVE